MKNPYLPGLALIRDVNVESPEAKTFTISFKNERPFDCVPGQFIEVSVFGYGEFPVSVSEVIDSKKGYFQITVREMGKATRKLMTLPANATIGVRGPFGNGFPVKKVVKRNIILIAGGIGLSPLKYAAHYLLKHRDEYGDVELLYGAASPELILFRETLSAWKGKRGQGEGLGVTLTVDKPDSEWQGRVGVVTLLVDDIKLNPLNTSAFICGPGPMLKSATAKLLDVGFDEEQLLLSFERRMQCGMGICGHCMMGLKRVCLDGPVFTYQDIKDTLERVF
ncbi:MAG: FAD/NAD(P)-binding protein [Chloroflexi bacterium]|nr:FAD/NAD(P)-binding protein [Chloroflexota bacterium]